MQTARCQSAEGPDPTPPCRGGGRALKNYQFVLQMASPSLHNAGDMEVLRDGRYENNTTHCCLVALDHASEARLQ